jgi:uncharacterized membrane protein
MTTVLAVVFFVVGVLAATGKLPRNPIIGDRTMTTMSSDEAWKAAHRAAAWSFFASAALLAVATFVDVPAWPVILLALVLVGALQAQLAARRVTRGRGSRRA